MTLEELRAQTPQPAKADMTATKLCSMTPPTKTSLQLALDAATTSNATIRILQDALNAAKLDECATEAEARQRLREAGFDEHSASLYASHHFQTFRGDCIDRGTAKP
jgi:hypothetical protein